MTPPIEYHPQVIDRDGERVVVDQEGRELVVRSRSQQGNPNRYHDPDIDAAKEGRATPACDSAHASRRGWMFRPLNHLPGYVTCKTCENGHPTNGGDGAHWADILRHNDVTIAEAQEMMNEQNAPDNEIA